MTSGWPGTTCRMRAGEPPLPGGRAEPGVLPKIEPPATSGTDGRISLEGIGADCLVLVLIEGPAIESKPAIMVTRPGPAMPVKGDGGLTVHGAASSISRPRAGRSRASSETPRPGSRCPACRSARHDPEFHGALRIPPNDQRRRRAHRLDGIAEGAHDRVVVTPPAGLAYLSASVLFDVGRGNGPAPLDLTLRKGVWIQGRVTDAASGQPLDADVEYHAFGDNPHLGPNPGYEIS